MPRSVTQLMEAIDAGLTELRQGRELDRIDPRRQRAGSRFAGEGASDEVIDRLASATPEELAALGLKVAEPRRLRDHDRRRPRSDTPLADTLVALAQGKAMAEGTNTAGGFLVEPEVSDEILRGLRARTAVLRLGARVVDVKKELAITSLSTGPSSDYVLENANLGVSDPVLASTPLLRPKEQGQIVPVSNRLLRDSADEPASVEELLRTDLAEVLALRSDLAFLSGSGTDPQPRGIVNQSGLTPPPSFGAAGRTPTYDDLKDTVQALRNVNAPFLKPAWIMAPRTIGTLEKIKTSDGHYLGETDNLLSIDPDGGGGTLLNFPFVTSTQVPVNLTVGASTDCSRIYFSSDWQECWVAQGHAGAGGDQLELALSGEASYTPHGGATWISAYQARQTLFSATLANDIGLRRPSLFTVVTGVRP